MINDFVRVYFHAKNNISITSKVHDDTSTPTTY